MSGYVCIHDFEESEMRYLFVVALSYMVSVPVYAEVSDRVILTFGLGTSYPISMGPLPPYENMSDISVQNANVVSVDGWHSGVHIGGGLGYILDKHHKFVLSSSIDYSNYNLNVVDQDIVRQDRSIDVVSVFTDIKVRFRSGDAIVIPYIKGGVGLFRSVQEDRILDASDSQNKIGFGVDAGVDLALSERAGFFAEAQYQVGLTEQKKTQHMPFKVGLFLR